MKVIAWEAEVIRIPLSAFVVDCNYKLHLARYASLAGHGPSISQSVFRRHNVGHSLTFHRFNQIIAHKPSTPTTQRIEAFFLGAASIVPVWKIEDDDEGGNPQWLLSAQ